MKGGRCEACQGDGVIKIEMHFLPDVYVTCDVCKGKRYNRETLEVTFKDKSIVDVLDMTVEEGAQFFKAVPSVREKLETLHRVGLDYIKVGQQATTLSGGEAQRVKLSKELSRRATGRTLYILDEPTTGLDPAVRHLIWDKIESLKATGTTILLTTHYLEEAQHLCDEIVIVDQGTIKSSGSPKKLIADQKLGYVALFKKDSSVTRLEEPTLEALTKAIQALDDSPTLIRPANLEDVFLKVTGRELSDDA